MMDDILKTYITHEAPFGPIDAGVIKIEHKEVLRTLFDPQNKIYNALKKNPSIIVGRRGSGKTAYLHSIFLGSKYGIVKEVKTSKTFAQIVELIEKSLPTPYISENVSELWEHLFYFAVIAEVAQKYPNDGRELRLLNDYLAKEGLAASATVDSFLWKVVKALSDTPGSNMAGAIANVVKTVTGVDFEQAKTIVVEVLRTKGDFAILLLDSLEQYPVEISSVAHAVSGLLKCVGQFNERNDRLNVRLCLPAELYHVFLDVSTNPIKDLAHSVTLHWVAGELLAIAAQRLALYLKLYFPREYDVSRRRFNLESREETGHFLRSYLPPHVKNRLGMTEDVLSYILRHTQLQPRHLLMYLNEIFIEERRHPSHSYPQVSQAAVIKGISRNEHLLCQEVFSGYQTIYPAARSVCEACIPELPLWFTHGDAHQVFNRRGKAASGKQDYWEFLRLLNEIGVVGRRIAETDRYVIGRFEYTEPHKLVVSSQDLLCLHPVFAKVFSCQENGIGKTIYPYGCDPEAEDYRHW